MSNDYIKNDKFYDVTHYKIFSLNGVTNLLIGVTLFSIFLTVFYFTYASKVENDILEIQINNLVKSFTDDLKNVDVNKDKLNGIINGLTVPDMSDADNTVAYNNKQLIIKSFKICIILGIFCLFFALIMHFVYKVDIKSIIITNFIILLFVAFTEIFFLNMIAKKYMSLDPNSVKKNIVQNLIKLLE